ncbi:MAG: AAA family ATPase [Chloroflexi bacterium]|nr:AAA family ATPase [Chloroflexota bacterium]
MRIRQLHIDGFGRFSGVEYGPLESPVTVFYGPNEAGKSTLLEFVRRVLFGFPRRNARVNAYPALAGGRYGGRIAIETSDGGLYEVRRTSGRSFSGDVALTSGSGEPLPETELTTLLGNNSRDVFEQVFAFTLNELYSDELLSDANVNSQIYSAGMGVTSLQEVMNTLDRSRNGLFRTGGSTQEIYSAANRLETIDSTLQEVADNAARYGELTSRLQQVENELEGSAEQRRRIQSRYNRQVTLQRAWEAWNDSVSAEQELAALPVIDDFPADGVNRLEALEERVRTARREYESARLRMTEAEGKAKVKVDHGAILKHSSDIRRLQNGRTAFDGSIKDLPERRAELDGHVKTLTDTLKDLGPDWDEARLEGFDLSIAVRQEITQHGDRLREASAEQLSRRSDLRQNIVALEEATDAESKAQREFEAAEEPNLNTEQIRQRRNLVRTARTQLAEIGQLRQNVLNLQGQLEGLENTTSQAFMDDRSRTIGASLFIFGMVLLIGGGILGGTAIFIGVIAGIALGGLGAYLFLSVTPAHSSGVESPLAGPIRESLRRTETTIQGLESRMAQEAAPLGLDQINDNSLRASEELVDEEEGRLRERTRLSDAFEAAKDLARQRQSRAEESAIAVTEADRKLEAAQGEWQAWLTERGLLDSFTPETAGVLQGQVELGRSRLGDVRSWQQRIMAIQKDIDEYVDAVEPLASAFDVTFDRNDPRTVAAAADRLVTLFEEVRESVRKREGAEAELDEAEMDLEGRKSDLERAKEDLGQLLQSGGAKDAEEFRARADLFRRRTSLEEKARAAQNRLQQLSGPGEAFERLQADLASTDPQSTTDQLTALQEERDNAEARHEELSTERGSVQNELRTLMGEEESSRLRMERNVLLEQIKGNARDWARLTLAQSLLDEARRKFERERQPGVVRHAEKFFTNITEGRYRQVYAPLGEQTITVTDAEGGTKQPSELSRGTREQLFLSLRFGLIRELGQRTEPLPVVVDEVLVNFDPDRALRAAAAFTELSGTNQVLVFTCHPTVVELFRNAASVVGVDEPDLVTIS